MDKKLLKNALVKYFSGLVLMGLLLFVPAGSFAYWQGWLLMGILFLPMLAAGLVMYGKAPELLRSRLDMKEEQSEQKQVIALSGGVFVLSFLLAGLNHRFGWLTLPRWLVWTAAGIFLLAYLLFGEVLRENAWLSRTVRVREEQTLVDTGLYGLVRHPMYSATVLLFLAMPLVLASPLSFLVMLLYLPIIVKRIRNEEEVLERELAGYREYKTRVKYRLLPGIW